MTSKGATKKGARKSLSVKMAAMNVKQSESMTITTAVALTSDNKTTTTSTSSNVSLATAIGNMKTETSSPTNSSIDIGGPELAMRQVENFGFTSHEFMDEHRDIMVRCWARAINEVTLPMLIEKTNLKVDDQKKFRELRNRLLNRLFQNGKFDLIFHQAEKFVDKNLLDVPPFIKGPDEKEKPAEKNGKKLTAADEDAEWDKIEALEFKIMKLRIKIKYLKDAKYRADCDEWWARGGGFTEDELAALAELDKENEELDDEENKENAENNLKDRAPDVSETPGPSTRST